MYRNEALCIIRDAVKEAKAALHRADNHTFGLDPEIYTTMCELIEDAIDSIKPIENYLINEHDIYLD